MHISIGRNNIRIVSCLFLLFSCYSMKANAQSVVYPSSFTVSKNGDGNFKTIQEAINAVRDFSQQKVKIFIKDGIYDEKLVIPSWKTNISLVGESKEKTIITHNDYSGKLYLNNIKDAYGKTAYSTFNSYTVLVQGNDITIQNLTIQNSAGRVGQAVALDVVGTRCQVLNCNLLGNQDTLLTNSDTSLQYYADCYIEGTTDFIFGPATAVFSGCTIKSLTNSYITAASTPKGQEFGYVFFDCKLIAAPEAKKVFLGRPWRPYAQVVYIRTKMGDHILPQGWDNWRNPENEKTAYYAEYASTGPGANTSERVNWSRQLTKKEVKKYTLSNILKGWDLDQK